MDESGRVSADYSEKFPWNKVSDNTRIEREVRGRGDKRLQTNVSITAEPFFRRMGFRVGRRQIKIYRNRAFKQAVMEKRLTRGVQVSWALADLYSTRGRKPTTSQFHGGCAPSGRARWSGEGCRSEPIVN